MGTEKTFSDRDFENYQIILDNSSNKQITLMGIVLAFQAAGYTGIYQILSTKENVLDQNNVIRALAIVMIIITGILLLVWCREHRLINQCISDLKKDKVRFPEEDKWMGVTGCTWRIVHWGSLVIWFLTIFFPECIFNFLRS